MYENLPDRIKKQVLFFLQEEDDFVSAKIVYDAWFKRYKQNELMENTSLANEHAS